jgi:hypothetical protein
MFMVVVMSACLRICWMTLADSPSPRPLVPLMAGMFIFGVASGAAIIPYSVIKEVNPDKVKGGAANAINLLVFGITAVTGHYFALLFGRGLATTTNPVVHFQQMVCFGLSAVSSPQS